MEIKNRVVMTAANLAYASEKGLVTEKIVDFYRERARGGTGLLVAGAIGVDPERVNTAGTMQLSSDECIPGMRELTGAVHEEDGKIFAQLWHPGAYALPSQFGGACPVAPSSYYCSFSRCKTEALSIAEIQSVIQYFADASGRAKTAGFDGLEIMASAGYLISQFLSPLTNMRNDSYGGSLSGRMTFLREIIQAVRAEAGPDLPVMVRLSGNDFMAGGNNNDDCIRIAQECELYGADALDITGGWHESRIPQLTEDVPQGAFAYLAARVKRNVSIPVVACNRMNEAIGEQLLEEGSADYIGFCRQLIADPEYTRKIRENTESIKRCTACNRGCLDRIFKGKPLECVLRHAPDISGHDISCNAETEHGSSARGKNIIVCGGSTSGVRTAIRLAEEGTINSDVLRFLFLYRAESPDFLYDLLTHNGRKITIVEPGAKLCADSGGSARVALLNKLKLFPVDICLESELVASDEGTVTIKKQDGSVVQIKADDIVGWHQ